MVCRARSQITNVSSVSNHAIKMKNILSVLICFKCFVASFCFELHMDRYIKGCRFDSMHSSNTVLLLLLVGYACPRSSAYEISCSHLYDNLKKYVRSSDGWPLLEDVDACMSDSFLRKSLMHMNTTTLQKSANVFHLTNDSFSLAELVTFSLIGRHFIAQETNQVFFFNWNRLHQSLSLEQLPCEFSRPLYTFVLLCTLLTVLCIVVLQEQVKKNDPSHALDDGREKETAGVVSFRKTTRLALD